MEQNSASVLSVVTPGQREDKVEMCPQADSEAAEPTSSEAQYGSTGSE